MTRATTANESMGTNRQSACPLLALPLYLGIVVICSLQFFYRKLEAVPLLKTLLVVLALAAMMSANSMGVLLNLLGHRVRLAHDGKKAVELALLERPEVILMDVGLPMLDGYQACRLLRQSGLGDCLIVAMTGYGQDHDRIRSRSAGFDQHLVKPIELETIRSLFEQEDDEALS